MDLNLLITFPTIFHCLSFQPGSDLLGLVQVLVVVFGEEPPVFSKTSTPQRPPPPVPYTTASVGVPSTPPYPATGCYLPSILFITTNSRETGIPPEWILYYVNLDKMYCFHINLSQLAYLFIWSVDIHIYMQVFLLQNCYFSSAVLIFINEWNIS